MFFIIFLLSMGCVTQTSNSPQRQAVYQNQTDLQSNKKPSPNPQANRPVPRVVATSKPTRNIWQTEAPEVTFENINGHRLSRIDFSFDYSDEALLTSINGSKIDRRELACSSCMEFYPSNCIGLVHAEYSDQASTSEAKGTAWMISEMLALTSAHTFCHITPETNKLLIVPPRKFYLGLLGEFIMANEKTLNPNNFFRVEDYKINEKYIGHTEKIASLQKNLTQNHTRMSEKQIKEAAERIHDLKVQSEEHDYAVIKLERKVPLKQFLKLKICGEKTNKDVKVQGYEVEKTGPQSRRLKQYFHSGSVNQQTPHAVYYNVDTKTQQSGSPVLFNNNGQIQVVAIHKGYNPRINLNVGTKITQELINMVKGWGREMKVGFKVQRTMTIDQQMDQKSKELLEKMINQKEKMAQEHSEQMSKVNHELSIKAKKLDRALADLKTAEIKGSDQELQIAKLNNTIKEQQFYLERKAKDSTGVEIPASKQKDKQIDRLTEEVHRKNMRIKNYEKDLNKKSQEIERLLERISQYENEQDGNFSARHSEKDLTLSKRLSIPMTDNFEWDSLTPYYHYFTVDNRIAELKDGGQRYQITSKEPLYPRSVTVFRLNRYGGSTSIGFGVITEERKEQRWSGDQEDSIGFLTYPNNKKGIIRINGEAKTEYISACYIPEGKSLTMEIDSTKMSVAFGVQGGRGMSFSLPEMFRNRKLFVYAMMASKQDQVQVLI